MLLFAVLISFYSIATGDIVGDLSLRQQFQSSLPDFLKEEAILNSYVDSLPMPPEDHFFLTSVLDPVMVPERDVSLYLFTKSKPQEPVTLKVGDTASLRNLNLATNDSTKVIIHGWTDNGNSSWIQDMRRNYLATECCNVIIVDWSAGSSKEYLVSASLTKQVGKYVSRLLAFLLAEGVLAYENVHVLGHSLGAHVAGTIGESLSGRIARITGMDPARPDFEAPVLKELGDRLDLTDAQFVDVIHTCAGTAGFIRPIGHVDFYPNGGSFRQPGCPVLLTQHCSHARSHQYMAESIINPMGFAALACNGWTNYKYQECDGDKDRVAYMGEYVDKDARGIYYLETNADSPYGRGPITIT